MSSKSVGTETCGLTQVRVVHGFALKLACTVLHMPMM